MLFQLADLLELKSENPYRIRAYQQAARQIQSLGEDVEDVHRQDRLGEIPGIGPSIAAKIGEYLQTGRLAYLDQLRQEVAPGLVELFQVPTIGPARARLINQGLGIRTLAELDKAVAEHRLRALRGFGERSEERIGRELARLRQRTRRLLLGTALPAAEEVVRLLADYPTVEQIAPAGSIRRMKETIGDIDLLVASARPRDVIEAFCTLSTVREVLARGSTRASVLNHQSLQIDLRVVEPAVWGAALQYFTGSKEHNIALRDLAIQRGFKLSEYGIFEQSTGRLVAAATEEEVYGVLDLPWIPPEIRENRGEIDAGLRGALPRLVEERQIRGDLHLHSDWSDGLAPIEQMVEAAKARGYAYAALTDHSFSFGSGGDLSPERVREQADLVAALNRKHRPFRILHGMEVNIRSDGSLACPEELLARLDYVCASIHSGFAQPRERITERMIRAIRHPLVHAISHPRGRLLGQREPYAVDLEAVLRAAAETGTAFEINGQPSRLDLDDVWARRARQMGVRLVVNTDAHAPTQLAFMRYAVAVARRAWLEKPDVLNTLSADRFVDWLQRRRRRAA